MPTNVVGLPANVTAISVGDNHMLALSGGVLYAWGNNSSGQLRIGQDRGAGGFSTPQVVPGMTNVTAIAAGGTHSLAIRNGGLYSWGYSIGGAVGNGAGGKLPGVVYSPYASPTLTSGVTSIAAGFDHSLVAANGSAYAFGFNLFGQAGIGTDAYDPDVPTTPIGMGSGVTQVFRGQDSSFALKDGNLYAWGYNNARNLAAGERGSSVLTPTLTDDTVRTGVTAVAGGGDHTLFIKDGSIYAVGSNRAGQLGIGLGGTPIEQGAVRVTYSGTWIGIAAGIASSYALNTNGTLLSWGSDDEGELGRDTPDGSAALPRPVAHPAGYVFTSVAAFDSKVAAILARPDAAVGATAIGPVLDANGLSPATPAIAGAVAIDPRIAAGRNPLTVRLALADPTQAGPLIDDLNILYGVGTASFIADGGTYQVQLLLAGADGTPGYFNFDFTTVVAAGGLDPLGIGGSRAFGSVPIVGVSVVPEPATLGTLAVAATGLLARRRRREGRRIL